MPDSHFIRLGLVALGVCCLLDCSTERTLPPCDDSPELATPPRDPDAVVVTAVGDIADCPSGHQDETAALVREVSPDLVLTLGDTVYPNGALDEFLDCYHPSWGEFRPITRAAVGNHEYHTPHAGPFYSYFCGGSGEPFLGRYSFDVGRWHVVVLNSNCGGDLDVPSYVPDDFGGCGADSPQVKWLKEDLKAHPTPCTLAVWHHPMFSSGTHGDQTFMAEVWRVLQDAGADLVLSGHEHIYERFLPMDAEGNHDPARGMVEFVVGTGGRYLHSFAQIRNNSAARQSDTFGVLKLILRPSSYVYEYLPTTAGAFADKGEVPCHD